MATEETTTPRPPSLIATIVGWAVNLIALGVFLLMAYLVWPFVMQRLSGQVGGPPPLAATAAPAPLGNVGGQAPPSVRGTNPEPEMAPAVATPVPIVSHNGALSDTDYNATSEAQYQATLEMQAAPATPEAISAPLPLNSAGQPIIDAQQQQQLSQAAELAAQEAMQAQQAARIADAQSRAPDVSKEDAEQMMHRDLCHVPRADPHTCAQGLYKPTPIGAP